MADLFFESIFHGNDQFHGIRGWVLVGLLGCMLLAELYLVSEIMRIFDAVLIIPIYNSLQILSTIALSGVYWDNFQSWSVRDSLLFIFGLVLIFSGIGAVSHGQKHQSMAHHADDKRHYIIGAKQNKDGNATRSKIHSFSGNVDDVEIDNVTDEDLP